MMQIIFEIVKAMNRDSIIWFYIVLFDFEWETILLKFVSEELHFYFNISSAFGNQNALARNVLFTPR